LRDAATVKAGTSDDAFLGGALLILQPEAGYRAGLDAVLLAAAAPVEAGFAQHVLDVGAGVGAVGLAVAHRVADADVTLVERDPALTELARANIARNGLSCRVRVVEADVTRPLRELELLSPHAESFDHVLANPPFNAEGRGTAAGHALKAAGNAMPSHDLGRWVRFMAAMARPGGTATLIHRAEALGDLLEALSGRFGNAAVLPLYPREGEPANRVLVQAAKGSRAPLRLLPGLVVHGPDQGFRPEIDAILRHGAALDLGGSAATRRRR
jgi:tRNA1(Val) A37 N6-methylase TrmN6